MRGLFLFIVLLIAVFTVIAVSTDVEPVPGTPVVSEMRY